MEADFLRILDLIRRQIKSPDAANLPADASLKESLGKSCRIFFDFYEFSPAALVLVDRSGRIQAANLTLETFSGVVREELIGRSLDLSVLEADRDILYQALKKIFKSRKPASCELRLQKQSSDGSLWVRFDGIYDRDLAGHPACRAMLVDIDRQKSAESDMARLAAIVQSSEDAIIRLDPAGIITDWNPAAEKTYGYRAPEAVGRHIRLILPPGRGREVDRLIGRLRDGNEVRTFETVRRTKAGRDIAISLTVSAIRSPLGELTALATNEREITRRKRLEAERNRLIEALYQERLRLEAVFNQIPAGLYIAEAPSGKIVMNNKKAVDLLGHPLIAADGYRDYQLYGALRPDGTPYRPEDYPMTRAIIDGEVIVEEEMIYRRGDGTLTQFSVNACPIRDVEGRIFAGVLIFHDISQLKKAHDELETRVALRTAELSLTIQALENEVLEHQKARKQISIAYDALNSTTSGIIITDADLRVRFANPACLRLFGCGTPRDLIGQNAAGLFSAQQFKKFGGATLILQQSLGQTQELSVQCADGRSFPVQIAYSEVADSEGAVVGKMASLTDITARKKTAAALQESERRLRRLSRKMLDAQENERKLLAREIHDSISGDLAAIKMCLEEKLDKMTGAAPDGTVSLETIIATAQGAIRETRRISARLRPSMLDDLGLISTIDWFCREFEKQHPQIQLGCRLEIAEDDVPEELKVVIYRILQEAINNVAKHSDADRVLIELGKNDGELILSVQDNCRGFDPGSVNANPDPMSGYGLSNMRDRAEICGGTLEITSQAGAGATVHLILPQG